MVKLYFANLIKKIHSEILVPMWLLGIKNKLSKYEPPPAKELLKLNAAPSELFKHSIFLLLTELNFDEVVILGHKSMHRRKNYPNDVKNDFEIILTLNHIKTDFCCFENSILSLLYDLKFSNVKLGHIPRHTRKNISNLST